MITVYHPDYQSYFFGENHPFSPMRYEMVLDLIGGLGHDPAPEKPQPVSENRLLRVHGEAFVQAVRAPSQVDHLARYGFSAGDTPPFEGMHEAASIMGGGSVHAANVIATGRAHRVLQLGGGLHHAHRSRASGFCIYNDLALAISKLKETFDRVAYIDIDVHHGDGVQSIFFDDPDVMTISLHESGRYLYPGTGFPHEIGEGAGEGTKLNVPLEPRTSDASYISVFEKVIPHALNWFHPDVLVVQCGADAHQGDPLAHLELSTDAYANIFGQLFELAERHTEGRLLCTLGGGYRFGATSRIWTLLYLMLARKPVPEKLPQPWIEKWGAHIDHDDFMDDIASLPEEPPEVAKKNKQQATQLMNRAARQWRL